MLGKYLDGVRKKTPLVHNITNYVTVNDVANILLALRGRSDTPTSHLMRVIPHTETVLSTRSATWTASAWTRARSTKCADPQP